MVSVVIPTFNRRESLMRAISSVVSQTEKRIEIVVVNDHGDDVTDIIEAVRPYVAVKLCEHDTNKGLAAARNTGIRRAAGHYIALLDDDDIFFPHHLEVALQHLGPAHRVVYTDAVRAILEPKNNQYTLVAKTVPYSIDYHQDLLLFGNIAPVNAFVFERQAALHAGLFDESLTTQEDWEFWIRLSRRVPFKHVAQRTVQVNWPTDGTTMTFQRRGDFEKNHARITQKYRSEIESVANKAEILEMFRAIWQKDGQRHHGPLVSIIVLVHNELAYTRKCIDSLIRHTEQAFELIVVDNGSEDGTGTYLEQELPDKLPPSRLKVIRNADNLGYAAGNNLGMAAACAPYLLLLNNDVVVTPGWLDRMIACAERVPAAGIVGPMTNRASGPQVVEQVAYNTDTLEGLNAFAQTHAERHAGQMAPFGRVVGFSMLIKREVIDRIGGLDHRYGLGNFEDDDFNIRSLVAGYQSWIALDSFIHHFGSRTFAGAKIDMKESLLRNWAIYKAKWGLPEQLAYGEPYAFEKLASQPYDKDRHHFALPDIPNSATDTNAGTGERDGDVPPTPPQTDGGRAAALNAIATLAHHFKVDPHDALSINDLGVLHTQLGQFAAALECHRHAHELAPENITFSKNLADLLFIKYGDFETAMQIYCGILAQHPDDVDCLMAAGHISATTQAHGDAATFFNRVRELAPDHPEAKQALERLAAHARSASQPAPSEIAAAYQRLLAATPDQTLVRALEAFAAENPRFADVHNDLGVLYDKSGAADRALGAYRQAVGLAPENTTFIKNMADHFWVVDGDPATAARCYLKVLELDAADAEALHALALISEAVGDHEGAEWFAQKAAANAPASSSAQTLLAENGRADTASPAATVAGGGQQQHDAAIDHVGVDTEPVATLYVLAGSSLPIPPDRLERFKTIGDQERICVVIPAEAATEHPDQWEAMAAWIGPDNLISASEDGLCAALTQHLCTDSSPYAAFIHEEVQAAEGWLRRLMGHLAALPQCAAVGPVSNFAQGKQRVAVDTGGDDAFESVSQRWAEAHRDERVTIDALNDLCLVISKRAMAMVGEFDPHLPLGAAAVHDWCLRARTLGYQHIVAYDTLVYGRTVDESGENGQQALGRKWNQLVQTSPDWKDKLRELERIDAAWRAYRSDGVSAALRASGAVDADAQLGPGISAALLEICLLAGQFDRADGYGQRLLDQHPQARTLALVGMAKEGLQDYAAARDLAERALQINPKQAEALNLMGILAWHAQDNESAHRFLAKAIEADAGYGEAYANLGTLIWPDDPEAAFGLYRTAFRLTPDHLDTAGLFQSAMEALDRHADGEPLILAAIAKYPDVQFLRHLAIDLYLRLGQPEPALTQVSEVLLKFKYDDDFLAAALQIRERAEVPALVPRADGSPTLALCMIVKDEAAHLARCLDSVSGLADEVIVVDTGSSDATPSIAKIMGARLIEYTSPEDHFDFAEARNVYLEAATADWLFILDADEVISRRDHQALRTLIEKGDAAHHAYTVVTRNYDTDSTVVGWTANAGEYPDEEQGSGWIPTEKVRLFPNDDRLSYSFPVHEVLEPSLLKNGFSLKKTMIPVHHYGKLDRAKTERKHAFYYELGVEKLRQSDGNPHAIRELAIQAGLLKKYDQAIELWGRFLKLKQDVPDAYVNLATAHFNRREYRKAFQVAKRGYRVDPDFRESQYNLALTAMHVGELKTTLSLTGEILEADPNYQPATLLFGCACLADGRKAEGRAALARLEGTRFGVFLDQSIGLVCENLTHAGRTAYVEKIQSACSSPRMEKIELAS